MNTLLSGLIDHSTSCASSLWLPRVLITVGLAAPEIVLGQQRGMARQPELRSRTAPELRQDALRFRDLNRNGAVDLYEDWRLAADVRARDLIGRMTLEEKAGTMMHGTARSTGPMGGMGPGPAYDVEDNTRVVQSLAITSLLTRLSLPPAEMAAQNNRLQELAERGRLGIPVTVSTDPRHHFQAVFGASGSSDGFSKWPETLGFGATGDAALVRQFGDIARQEYRAVGIHMALSPQADLATEPRWPRVTGTFGENADLVGRLARAYVEGFQGGPRGTTRSGVLTVIKHWVGYGAAKDGFDSHSYYGRYAAFSGDNLAYHARPFLGAFAAGVAGVMPTYSILDGATMPRGRARSDKIASAGRTPSDAGAPLEAVGAGFNRQLLTDLLRGQYGYRGVVLTDWLITNDCGALCRDGAPAGQRMGPEGIAMPWGVEALPMRARYVKAVQAGVDQFGGVEEPRHLIDAVRAGELTEARLDSSVARILADKFRQGLFEAPYVDEAGATASVGQQAFLTAARAAQRRSLVLLENEGVLPLRPRGTKVFLHRVEPRVATALGFDVVTDLVQAQLAIVRADAPFETLHPGYFFGMMQHEGDLGFRDGDAEYETIKRIMAAVPTVVSVYLDRPAILSGLKGRARAIVANFGVDDTTLLEMLTGAAPFTGRLPFELPSSMAAVTAQRSDVPNDSERPLYPVGFGRTTTRSDRRR